jgi:hypothetical protein
MGAAAYTASCAVTDWAVRMCDRWANVDRIRTRYGECAHPSIWWDNCYEPSRLHRVGCLQCGKSRAEHPLEDFGPCPRFRWPNPLVVMCQCPGR